MTASLSPTPDVGLAPSERRRDRRICRSRTAAPVADRRLCRCTPTTTLPAPYRRVPAGDEYRSDPSASSRTSVPWGGTPAGPRSSSGERMPSLSLGTRGKSNRGALFQASYPTSARSGTTPACAGVAPFPASSRSLPLGVAALPVCVFSSCWSGETKRGKGAETLPPGRLASAARQTSTSSPSSFSWKKAGSDPMR